MRQKSINVVITGDEFGIDMLRRKLADRGSADDFTLKITESFSKYSTIAKLTPGQEEMSIPEARGIARMVRELQFPPLDPVRLAMAMLALARVEGLSEDYKDIALWASQRLRP